MSPRPKSAYQGFLSVSHITETKNPCVLVLTRCHVTDINHVLTRSHVTEINYVDRGVAARAPLQFGKFEGSTFEIEAMEGRNMANGSNFRIWKQEEIESLELS
jgi:hypothetical protein